MDKENKEDSSKKFKEIEESRLKVTPEDVKKSSANPYKKNLLTCSAIFGATLAGSFIINDTVTITNATQAIIPALFYGGSTIYGVRTIGSLIEYAMFKNYQKKYPDKVYDLESFEKMVDEETEKKFKGR